MMKSSIDKIVQQIQESVEERLQKYIYKPVNDVNLDAVKSQLTSFLQSVMYEEGYDSRDHIKVGVEQDIKDLSKINLTLIPISEEGLKLVRKLEEGYNSDEYVKVEEEQDNTDLTAENIALTLSGEGFDSMKRMEEGHGEHSNI